MVRAATRTPAIEDVWNRIEMVLTEFDPRRLEGLNRGASDDAVLAIERALDAPLPDDFKASLRRHDGQIWTDSGILGGAWELTSSEEILRILQMHQDFMHDPDLLAYFSAPADALVNPDKIKGYYWNSKWVPVSDNSGTMHMLDLDPATKGTYGQVLLYRKSMGPIRVIAKSFAHWLDSYAKRYEKKHAPARRPGESEEDQRHGQ